MRAASTLLPLLLGSLTVTCADPSGPLALAGEYALIAEDGRALPRLLSATQACDLWLTGGSLTFGPGDAFALELDEEFDCTRGGGGVQVVGRGYVGFVVVNSGLVRPNVIALTLNAYNGFPQVDVSAYSASAMRGTITVALDDSSVSAWGSLRPMFRGF